MWLRSGFGPSAPCIVLCQCFATATEQVSLLCAVLPLLSWNSISIFYKSQFAFQIEGSCRQVGIAKCILAHFHTTAPNPTSLSSASDPLITTFRLSPYYQTSPREGKCLYLSCQGTTPRCLPKACHQLLQGASFAV